MNRLLVPAFLTLTATCLSACAQSGGPLATSNSAFGNPWAGSLRYTPTSLTLSLSAPNLQFIYVDADPVNGVVPLPQDFLSDFSDANSSLESGPCANVAALSYSLISPDSYSGQTTPTVVVAAYPLRAGSCTQNVNLGLTGTGMISIAVAK